MAFQPFGFHFEIKSQMPLSQTKAAIRSNRKKWFDLQNGARGWVAGPFICLWFEAFNRSGPMLLGRMRSDGFTTRITGRAGSDINGLVWFTILVIFLLVMFARPMLDGEATQRQLVLVGGLLLGSPLMYWWASSDRNEAEPLVRFLQQTLNKPARGDEKTEASFEKFTLTADGVDRGPVTRTAIHEALLNTGVGDFVILEQAPELYMQTAMRKDGFVLEKREGDQAHHFAAVRNGAGGSNSLFTFDEVEAAFMTYVSGTPTSAIITWRPMDVHQ